MHSRHGHARRDRTFLPPPPAFDCDTSKEETATQAWLQSSHAAQNLYNNGTLQQASYEEAFLNRATFACSRCPGLAASPGLAFMNTLPERTPWLRTEQDVDGGVNNVDGRRCIEAAGGPW